MKRASYLYNQRLTGGEQEFSCSSQLQSSMVELEFVFGLKNLMERRLITVLIYVVKKRSMGAPSFSLLAFMLNAVVPTILSSCLGRVPKALPDQMRWVIPRVCVGYNSIPLFNKQLMKNE